MTDQGFTPDRIDTSRPHPARMYDYYLGGQDNYEVDRAAAEQVLTAAPDVRLSARANRDFLQRAVRSVVQDGVRQIIDIGTGIPTSPNTHEAAHAVDNGVKVAYIDNDPIVSTYAGAKLTNAEHTGFLLADMRDPKSIVEHPALRALIDFSQPVALLLVSVMHFVTDDEDPTGLIGELTGPLAPGSRLVLSHATGDFHDPETATAGSEVYKKATAHLTLRTRDEVVRLFDGFELEEPGVVQVPRWRPEGEITEELSRAAVYSGVGVKR